MLDPNDPDILYGYSVLLASTGRLRDARRVQNQILAQDPFVPNYNRQAADVLWAMGDNDAAITMLEALAPSEARNNVLAKVYATAGRYAQAANTLLAIPQSINISRESLVEAAKAFTLRAGEGQRPGCPPRTGTAIELGISFLLARRTAPSKWLNAKWRQVTTLSCFAIHGVHPALPCAKPNGSRCSCVKPGWSITGVRGVGPIFAIRLGLMILHASRNVRFWRKADIGLAGAE